MDNDTLTLIITQALTFLLLVVSETLPLTDTPYNGIVQYLLAILQGSARPVGV
jgi:hypothetical protein